MFKTQNQSTGTSTVDGVTKTKTPTIKKNTATSLLESNRLQNLSIMRRKIELSAATIVSAIQRYV